MKRGELDFIRWVAIGAMIIDHMALFLMDIEREHVLRFVGCIALPLFAYGIAEGEGLTRDVKKYGIRLMVLAVVSQVPYMLLGMNRLNPVFGLMAGLLMIQVDRKWGIWSLGILAGSLVLGVNGYTVLMCCVFYKLKGEWLKLGASVAGISIIRAYVLGWHELGGILAYVAIRAPGNAGKVRVHRWAYYAVYPLHLLVIWGVRWGILST